MAEAEEAAKPGKGNRKFAELKGLKSSEDAPPGGGGNLFTNSMQRPKTETDSERKAREQKERFDKLAEKVGTAIR